MLPEEYVLHVVEQIRSTQLDEALLVLPFSQVISLLVCVSFWVEKVTMPFTLNTNVNILTFATLS